MLCATCTQDKEMAAIAVEVLRSSGLRDVQLLGVQVGERHSNYTTLAARGAVQVRAERGAASCSGHHSCTVY
jgi:hypothetical protein